MGEFTAGGSIRGRAFLRCPQPDLDAIAILGIGLTAASEVWVTTAHRQRLEQLEWVGQQYVQALASYYEVSPGSVKAYPLNLRELLEDRRHLTVRRHLRELYANPYTGKADFDLVADPQGGIRGLRVHVVPLSGSDVREFVHVASTVK